MATLIVLPFRFASAHSQSPEASQVWKAIGWSDPITFNSLVGISSVIVPSPRVAREGAIPSANPCCWPPSPPAGSPVIASQAPEQRLRRGLTSSCLTTAFRTPRCSRPSHSWWSMPPAASAMAAACPRAPCANPSPPASPAPTCCSRSATPRPRIPSRPPGSTPSRCRI